MTDVGAYRKAASYYTSSKQLQIKIEKQIDSTLYWTSTGIIALGTINSAYAFYLKDPTFSSEFIKQAFKKALSATHELSWQKSLTVLSTCGSGTQYSAKVVVAKDDYNIAHLNANLKHLQSRVDLLDFDAQHSAKELKGWVDLSEKITEITKQAIGLG